jgi:hypothetical protein
MNFQRFLLLFLSLFSSLVAIGQRGRFYSGKEPDLGPIDVEHSLIGAGLMLAGYLVYKISSGEPGSSVGMSISVILWIAGFLFCITLINGVFILASGLYAIGFGLIIVFGIIGLLMSAFKK